MAIGDYDSTPSNNNSVGGIDISEGCSPAGINNAIRQIMADLAALNATFGTGATGEIGTDIQAQNVLLQAIADGSVTAAEFGHLSGVTSPIQSQIDAKPDTGDIPSIAGLATETYVDNAVGAVTTPSFTSTGDALPASGGTITIPHGLASAPTRFHVWIECTSAEFGYSVGDIAALPPTLDGDGSRRYSTISDATNIYWQQNTGGAVRILQKLSTTLVTPSAGSWDIYIRAE